ncbi:hypothetical protein A33Q_2772 [Indibacter alkaliphilus LW1]|uniref:Uncharacterized protein n=1 Tax=Indibacter alkaliphilus (strain CCUG 57479 / KCTC 22604 / LW1) TaxID=1189612 RepID=S2DEG8_INDAL|nr:hypothetical protein A33Q_2772 [Indibacter alkaliphilus LW1]
MPWGDGDTGDAVIPLGRYQFESNSQLSGNVGISLTGCDSLGKISI